MDVTFWNKTSPSDVSVDTANSEEQMTGSHITKFHTPEDKQIVLEDLISQVDQDLDNWHDRQSCHLNMILIMNIITQAIHHSLHSLTVSTLLTRMN